jgi:hypothetical protein
LSKDFCHDKKYPPALNGQTALEESVLFFESGPMFVLVIPRAASLLERFSPKVH